MAAATAVAAARGQLCAKACHLIGERRELKRQLCVTVWLAAWPRGRPPFALAIAPPSQKLCMLRRRRRRTHCDADGGTAALTRRGLRRRHRGVAEGILHLGILHLGEHVAHVGR